MPYIVMALAFGFGLWLFRAPTQPVYPQKHSTEHVCGFTPYGLKNGHLMGRCDCGRIRSLGHGYKKNYPWWR